MEQAPVTRTCIKCGETKAFELFEKDKNSKFGRRHSCNKCATQRHKIVLKTCKHEEIPSTKACTKCKEVKSLELFSKALSCKFGKRSICKKCHAEQCRQYYKPIVKKPKEPEEPPLTRVCKKCSTEKKLTEFTIIKNCRHGRCYICKECKKKSQAELSNLPHNKIKNRERWKIYKEKNKQLINEKAKALRRKLYSNNPEKYKEISKKRIETLAKNYVKSILCRKLKLSFNDITEEQMQLQKESILLHREYEQLKQQLQ